MKSARLSTCLRLACGILFLLEGIPGATLGQQPAGAGTQSPPSQASASTPAPAPASTPVSEAPAAPSEPKISITDFAWLEGRWRGNWGPRVVEQDWLAPKAGTMQGTFRVVENEKILVIEMFTLVQKPDGIDMYFRHFTPELVPWEKADATVLRLSSLDGKRADFENPVNGEPKHAIFTRIDPDTFTSRSEIVPEQGDPQVTEITYHRLKPADGKPNAGSGGHR